MLVMTVMLMFSSTASSTESLGLSLKRVVNRVCLPLDFLFFYITAVLLKVNVKLWTLAYTTHD